MPAFTHSQKRGSALKRKMVESIKKDITEKTSEITSEYTEEKISETTFVEYQVFDNLNEKLTEITTEEASEKNTEIITSYTDKEDSNIVVSNSEINEKITPEKTVLSGERLIEQAKAQGDTITFEKQGVSFEIPSSFIKENNIEKDDLISISIKREEDKVNINVNVNNEPVDKIEGSKIVALGEDNELFTLDVDKVGEYTISDNNVVNKTDKKIIFYIIISIILVLTGGTSILLWRKRKL